MIKSNNRVYLTADKKRAVLSDSDEAAFLLVGEGGQISEESLEGIEGASELVTGKAREVKTPDAPARKAARAARAATTTPKKAKVKAGANANAEDK